MDVPGAEKPKLSVTIEDRVLTISGQISESYDRKAGDHIYRKERRSGKFERSVTLPGAVKADEMIAQYENGVLTVTVPKAAENIKSKSIQVQ
jgi:HSP20 family protein